MIPPFNAPKIEMQAPMVTMTVPAFPKIAVPASTTGVSLPARLANPTVPTHATEISTLMVIRLKMRSRGYPLP